MGVEPRESSVDHFYELNCNKLCEVCLCFFDPSSWNHIVVVLYIMDWLMLD